MLKARVFTALCLVAGFLAVLYLVPNAWAALVFAGIAALAAWEWAGLLRIGTPQRFILVGIVLSGCMGIKLVPLSFELWALAVLFWLLVAPFWLWRRWLLHVRRWLGIGLGAVLIVATWGALVGLHARNPHLLLATMALVWVADSAAYFSGRAFGRHKLAPDISPGKTWEGAAGGLLGVLAFGVLLRDSFDELRGVPVSILLGTLVLFTVQSIVGDLFESLIKRQSGLKDSGSLLPGHGGVLDRIDSLLPTLPLAALLLERTGR